MIFFGIYQLWELGRTATPTRRPSSYKKFFQYTKTRARTTVQVIKCLTCKKEDPSSISRDHVKTWDWQHVAIISVLVGRDRWIPEAHWMSFRFGERPSKKKKTLYMDP